MREAGGRTSSPSACSRGSVHEPREGVFDFSWLDRMLDLLHENGIARGPRDAHRGRADVAAPPAPGDPAAGRARTPAGPRRAPRVLPVDPVFRAYALRIVERLAAHVAGHPAVRMWHVSNELGGGNARCHCPVSNAALPRVGRGEARHRRGAERGLGHGVLGQLLLVVRGGDDPGGASPRTTRGTCSTTSASPRTSSWTATGPRRRAAPAVHARAAGDDQLHGRPRSGRRRLRALGSTRSTSSRTTTTPTAPTP